MILTSDTSPVLKMWWQTHSAMNLLCIPASSIDSQQSPTVPSWRKQMPYTLTVCKMLLGCPVIHSAAYSVTPWPWPSTVQRQCPSIHLSPRKRCLLCWSIPWRKTSCPLMPSAYLSSLSHSGHPSCLISARCPRTNWRHCNVMTHTWVGYSILWNVGDGRQDENAHMSLLTLCGFSVTGSSLPSILVFFWCFFEACCHKEKDLPVCRAI